MNLRRIQDIVEYQLSKSEEARDSDDVLYIAVLDYMRPNLSSQSLSYVFTHKNELNIPSYESVGRARRKLQAEKPWLKPSEEVQKLRADNEQKYLEYARMERR